MRPFRDPHPVELIGEIGWGACREVVGRVRRRVAARLELAALFGSRARGDARADSDIDLLLLFAALPPDREPQATHAERIAAHVADETGIPVTVWSVSREDLSPGWRTPMLVDALDDAVPLWPEGARVPRVRFSPADALFCTRCLLDRVEEGGEEVARLRAVGREGRAAERARDDLVRLCTGLLLSRGETRPRRGDAVRRVRCLDPELRTDRVLAWAEGSFPGPAGPPPSWRELAGTVGALRRRLERARRQLATGAGLATRG